MFTPSSKQERVSPSLNTSPCMCGRAMELGVMGMGTPNMLHFNRLVSAHNNPAEAANKAKVTVFSNALHHQEKQFQTNSCYPMGRKIFVHFFLWSMQERI